MKIYSNDIHWLSVEGISRTTETEQAISQGDVCSPSSGDPLPHGGGDMRADTQLSPGGRDMRADTQSSPDSSDVRADTQSSPDSSDVRADSQSSPGVADMRADSQPSELDSVGHSLDSLQLIEHSTVCDPSTVAVPVQNAPAITTCPVTVTSSIAKLQHAMSNWCTPATWAYLQEDEGGEGGERSEEKMEPPFLPVVHSVGQAQLQRSIFMQQLKRKSVNLNILYSIHESD